MKKVLCLLQVAVLCILLVACSESANTEHIQNNKAEEQIDVAEKKLSKQEKITEESSRTADALSKIEEYKKNKTIEDIDVTAEMLPKMQGYWIWVTSLEEACDVYGMKIDGKEYNEFYYKGEVVREGNIISVKGNKDRVMEVNCICQNIVYPDMDESVDASEYDYSWEVLSNDDFEKNLITTNSDGETDYWVFMGDTEEEFYKNMEERLGC